MSKCDVSIDFERASREFVGGEVVEGVVTVRANTDVDPRRIVLKSYWQTHGRGNKASGDQREIVLDTDAHLRSGEQRTYPFRVTAPQGPPTYHGHHLNVDHYVEVEVDVAWAKDPKAKEDFLLRAGPGFRGPPDPPDFGGQLAKLAADRVPPGTKVVQGKAATAIGLGCVGLFVLPFLIFFPPLVFVAALVIGGLYARHRMLQSRLGDVTFIVRPVRVATGDTLTVDVGFRSKKAMPLNAVTVTLTAEERCTSGSGTRRSTATYTVHTETHTLQESSTLRANEELRVTRDLPVHPEGAYSFEATDNSLRWSVGARVDIPNWPDWTETRQIVVVPAGTAGAGADVDAVVETSPRMDEGAAGSDPEWVEPGRAPDQPIADDFMPTAVTMGGFEAGDSPAGGFEPGDSTAGGFEAGVAAGGSAAGDLAALVSAIAATGRYSDERARLVTEATGREFALEVERETTEWTSSYEIDDYKDGRSIVGTLSGTRIRVRVRFKRSLNGVIDGLHGRETLRLRASLSGWDRLLDRPQLDALTIEGQ